MRYSTELYHYGVGHLDGGHSGRYPWGSGKNKNKAAYRHSSKKLEENKNRLESILDGDISVQELTDAELNAAIDRLRREEQYLILLGRDTLGEKHRVKTERGKSIVNNALSGPLANIVGSVVTSTLSMILIAAVKRAFGDKLSDADLQMFRGFFSKKK